MQTLNVGNAADIICLYTSGRLSSLSIVKQILLVTSNGGASNSILQRHLGKEGLHGSRVLGQISALSSPVGNNASNVGGSHAGSLHLGGGVVVEVVRADGVLARSIDINARAGVAEGRDGILDSDAADGESSAVATSDLGGGELACISGRVTGSKHGVEAAARKSALQGSVDDVLTCRVC